MAFADLGAPNPQVSSSITRWRQSCKWRQEQLRMGIEDEEMSRWPSSGGAFKNPKGCKKWHRTQTPIHLGGTQTQRSSRMMIT